MYSEVGTAHLPQPTPSAWPCWGTRLTALFSSIPLCHLLRYPRKPLARPMKVCRAAYAAMQTTQHICSSKREVLEIRTGRGSRGVDIFRCRAANPK